LSQFYIVMFYRPSFSIFITFFLAWQAKLNSEFYIILFDETWFFFYFYELAFIVDAESLYALVELKICKRLKDLFKSCLTYWVIRNAMFSFYRLNESE